jgi:hypothetical protein
VEAGSLDDEMGEAVVSATVESEDSSLPVRQDAGEEVKPETLRGDDEKKGGTERRLAKQVIEVLEQETLRGQWTATEAGSRLGSPA